MEILNNIPKLIKNKRVCINQNGPESKNGRIIDINSDYMTLHSDEGEIIYYTNAHLKNVSFDSRDPFGPEFEFQNTSAPLILQKGTFHDLLQEMQNRWIQVNGNGPESIVGVLSDAASQDFIKLIQDRDLVHIFTRHIKNVRFVSQNTQNKSSNTTNDNGDKQNTTTDSGDKQSGTTNSNVKQSGNSASGDKQTNISNSSGKQNSHSEGRSIQSSTKTSKKSKNTRKETLEKKTLTLKKGKFKRKYVQRIRKNRKVLKKNKVIKIQNQKVSSNKIWFSNIIVNIWRQKSRF